MRVRPLVQGAVLLGLLATAARPREADALAYFSTTTAVGGATMAIVGATMMGKQDPNKQKTGRTLLIVGLVVSGVCSSSAVGVGLLGLSMAYTADRVEDLEAEVAAGGGPMLDAWAAAYGLDRAEVLEIARATLEEQPVCSDEDARRFGQLLQSRIFASARIPDELAARILHELYLERGAGHQPWHEILAELSGVPTEELGPEIDRLIDERLAEAVRPGQVLSARAVLAEGASRTVDRIVDEIVENHWDQLQQRMAELAARAASGGPA